MPLLVGDRHQQGAAQPGLEVLLGQSGQLGGGHVGVEHRGDRHRAEVQPGAVGQFGRVVPGVPRGVAARHRDAVHVLGADRVHREGGHHGRVDAAGQADQHRAEAVLAHVGPGAGDQRGPDLGLVGDPRRDLGADRLGGRVGALAAQFGADQVQAVGEQQPVGVVAAGGGQVEVQHQQVLLELRRAGQHLAVRGDHDRVAVEDQLVLAADHVHVGERAAGLGGPAPHQFQPGVVLVPLVRRAVDDQQQAGPGLAGGGHPAAVLPDVLADRQRDVHPVHPHHRQLVAGDEPAVLVEHAVVRQVVLGEPGGDLAPEQHRGAVLR